MKDMILISALVVFLLLSITSTLFILSAVVLGSRRERTQGRAVAPFPPFRDGEGVQWQPTHLSTTDRDHNTLFGPVPLSAES